MNIPLKEVLFIPTFIEGRTSGHVSVGRRVRVRTRTGERTRGMCPAGAVTTPRARVSPIPSRGPTRRGETGPSFWQEEIVGLRAGVFGRPARGL